MVALVFGLFAALGPAHAQPISEDEVSEEIIVYDDNFARWDDTRWMVQAEFLFPTGVVLARTRNEGFRSYALQVRSVVKCQKDHKLSRKKYEVSCEIEDIGILATSLDRWRRKRDRELVDGVLQEIDAKLTGMKIQLQTDFRGAVTNIDLEGLSARNERERVIQESLRQIVSRLVAGFHLKIPNQAQKSGEWVEYSSALMQIPSNTASQGSTLLKHVVSRQGDLQIVQTVGRGSSQIFLPLNLVNAEFPHIADDMAAQQGADGASGYESAQADEGAEAADDGTGHWGNLQVTQESDIPATWDMTARGVAVFDRNTGIMSERVWVVNGVPTASSGQGTQLPPFYNAGRLQLLGEADRPDVGATKQVAPPGRAIEGLDPWSPIDTFGE